jgi:hypothetical protein
MLSLSPAAEPFSVHRQDDGRVPVFVVHGMVDRVAAAQLSAAICAFGGHDVIVDLRAAQGLDAGGERDLVLAARVCSVRLRLL